MRVALATLATVGLLLLAGCAQDADNDATTSAPPTATQPMLTGVVLDEAIRPVANATIRVQETNSTTTTGTDGLYAFDGLPTDRALVLVATKLGYLPNARQITLVPGTPVRMNFTLEAVPIKVPRHEVLPFNGLVGCQLATEVSGQNRTIECAGGTPDETRWDFPVEPDLAGVVVEINWEPTSPAAETLGARLETTGLGASNAVLAEVVGASPLRLVVPQITAERYYAAGGLMRLTVYAQPDNDANEAGAGAALAFQQDYRAFASLFYVAPPHPTYSVFN